MSNVPLKSLVFPGLDPTYTIPQKTSDLTNDSGFVNASGAASAAPVQSVDGKTGTVTVLPTGGSQGQVLKKSSGDNYSVEWADESGGGGGGTSDYTDLTNKPQIGGVTLTGNKTAADLSLATAAEVAAKYSKPSGGIPASDLAPAVQTSLGKADTALQSVPSTYRTAAAQDVIDEGKISAPSSPATGAFLVWNGTAWVAQTLSTWQGGSY